MPNSIVVPGDLRDLTVRQKQVLECVARGLRDKETARHLCCSENTVRTHMKKMFRALGVNNRASAVVAGLRRGDIKIV